MKLVLPTNIKIGSYNYKVKPIFDNEWNRSHENYGLCQNQDSVISVFITGNDSIDVDTLWHEVKHAIWFFMGLEEKEDDEEKIVSKLTAGELMVLKDNPELCEFLMNHVDKFNEEE